jgi:hypothetical protein
MGTLGYLANKPTLLVAVGVLWLGFGCSGGVHPFETVRKNASTINLVEVTQVDFVKGDVVIMSLNPQRDRAGIERVINALRHATYDYDLGKGGGRPDKIRILSSGKPRVFATDFARLYGLLGPEMSDCYNEISKQKGLTK